MDVSDAFALIAPAVPNAGGTWADLGAGGGTFTRALVKLLGPDGRVHAVDRDAGAMRALRGATIVTHVADFADVRAFDSLRLEPLDGVLIANALHFVPRAGQRDVLARVAASLVPNGTLVVVEYDGRAPSRWVPYPVSFAELGALMPPTLGAPVRIGQRHSAYGGSMYAAASKRTA